MRRADDTGAPRTERRQKEDMLTAVHPKARHHARLCDATMRWLVGLLAGISLLVGGCAITLVSAYDKESVDRTTEISKAVLKLYQDLLAVEPARRKAAVAGGLGLRHGEIESMMRLHLLKEQARARNDESTKVAENLLESWQRFELSHRSEDATALSDATLGVERGILERHLRAAFVAEEAKKLGGGK